MKQTVYRVESYDKEIGHYEFEDVYSKAEAQKLIMENIEQGYFSRYTEREIDVVQQEFEDCLELLCNQLKCSDCPYVNVRGAEDCLESAREDAKTDADKLLIISKMMKAIHY